jgi:ribosomal-protein-alanine N-acetyltransferase
VNSRLATAADIPAIIALEQQCASAAHWTEPQYQTLFQNNMAAKSAQQFILVMDENAEDASLPRSEKSTLLGFLIAHKIDREWELENIAVALTARRKGVATQLAQQFLHHAREASGEAVFLEVRESNQSARTLYEKLGFIQSGRRKAYYQDSKEDAILYRRALP